MSILSWGKCTIFHKESENGAPKTEGDWKELDTPKKDTTKITTTAGEEQVAVEEGGGIVDVKYGKASYQFEFDLFVKKGVARPFADEDGVIKGEHAFKVVPEDKSAEGALIDRCMLRVEETYSSTDGKMLHYVAKCLKPKTGQTVKPHTEE